MSFHLSQATWALIAQSLNHKSITPPNSRYTDTHTYLLFSPALLCRHFEGSPNRLPLCRVVGITPHGLTGCLHVAHCPVPSGQRPAAQSSWSPFSMMAAELQDWYSCIPPALAPTLHIGWLHTLEELSAWEASRLGSLKNESSCVGSVLCAGVLCLTLAICFRPLFAPLSRCVSHHLWACVLH